MRKFMFLCAALALSACDGSKFVPLSEVIDDEGVSANHDMIVLGDKLDDPYNVENITKAIATLYPTKADRVQVDPTDIYVRFLPGNEEQLRELESRGLELIDHPVDYEIVRDGDYYHDPSVDEGDITWQYAVVPVGFEFPADITCERLHDCYLSENDDSATKSAHGIDWDLVERTSFILTGNGNLLLDDIKGTKAGGAVPSGRICIVDPASGEVVEGVKGVKVSCNVFVKFDNAFTDADGNYSMRKTFRSRPRYRVVFKNRYGFAIGFNLIILPAAVSSFGANDPSGINVRVNSNSDSRFYSRCVVNNAAHDYYAMCERDDCLIKSPPANLRLWLFQNLESSSAPMLRQGALVESGLVKKYLGEYTMLLRIFLPDITLGLSGADDYAEIYSRTVHELAHASHYMTVGNEYWNKYIQYILTSFVSSGGVSYGGGTEEDHGYCEIGEMWAYYMQSRLYSDRYPDDARIFGTSFWFCPQIFYVLDEKGLDKDRIFAVLDDDVIDRDILKKKMTSMYPQFKTAINQAFNTYK